MKQSIMPIVGAVLLSAAFVAPAQADIDIKTPWADVYVGPDGVEAHGPWGHIDVPSKRRRYGSCKSWRKAMERYYESRNCDIDFTDNGCAVEEIECEH